MRLSYTKQAEDAIRAAGRTAREMKHPYIGSEHLLLGLRREYSGVAGQILAKNGVEEEKILHLMDELIAPSGDVLDSTRPKESPRLESILEGSEKEAVRLHCSEIGTEHLLLAIIRDVDCVAAKILITLNINLQKIFEDIMSASGVDPKEYQDELQEAARRRHHDGTVLHRYDPQGGRGQTGSGDRTGEGDVPSDADSEPENKE